MDYLAFFLAILLLVLLIAVFMFQTYSFYILFNKLSKVKKPSTLTNFTDYYLYLLFSQNNRISPEDFARGLIFWIVFSLYTVSYFMSIFIILVIFEDLIPSLTTITMPLTASLIILQLSSMIITFFNLLRKRLKDLRLGEASDVLAIAGIALIASLFYFLGIALLLMICLFMLGKDVNRRNRYGRPSAIFNSLKQRKETLTKAAELSLDRKDYQNAIRCYAKLSDKEAILRTQRKHLIHKYSILNSRIKRMKEKKMVFDYLEENKYELEKQLANELKLNKDDISTYFVEEEVPEQMEVINEPTETLDPGFVFVNNESEEVKSETNIDSDVKITTAFAAANSSEEEE